VFVCCTWQPRGRGDGRVTVVGAGQQRGGRDLFLFGFFSFWRSLCQVKRGAKGRGLWFWFVLLGTRAPPPGYTPAAPV
jgi:hypothetical protein